MICESLFIPNIDAILVKVHEYAHGISFLINPDYFFPKKEILLYGEFISIFFELVSKEYIEKNFGFEHSKNIIKNNITELLMDCNNILEHKDILKKLQSSNNISYKRFCQQEAGYVYSAKKIINISIEEKLNYIYSNIIALHLYCIYLNDKKYALNIAKNLIELASYDDDMAFDFINTAIFSEVSKSECANLVKRK